MQQEHNNHIAIDKTNLEETMGVADPECTVCMQVHFGKDIRTGEPVLGYLRLTHDEVEKYRGEAFLKLLIGKANYLLKSLDAYSRSQTN